MTEKQLQINVDLYELLQVHPKADIDVIRKAYHTIMKQHHPDKGGSNQKSKSINYAYEVLTNKAKREQYDRERALFLKHKLKGIIDNKNPKIEELLCPVFTTNQVVVADERGKRILMLNMSGDIVWQYGGGEFPNEILEKPKFASFAGSNILVVDESRNRVFEMTLFKKIVWECDYKILDNPTFALRLPSGNTLITNNKKVIEVDPGSKIVWQYAGKSGFNLIKSINPDLFQPISAVPLANQNVLITDNGNQCVLQVNKEGKIIWQYPQPNFLPWGKKDKEDEFTPIFNFAHHLDNNNYLIISDKITEITDKYKILWEYDMNDVDIHWAFKIGANSVLIDYVHLVRKGINQEIMLIDKNGKTIWKYYYSQYRCI